MAIRLERNRKGRGSKPPGPLPQNPPCAAPPEWRCPPTTPPRSSLSTTAWTHRACLPASSPSARALTQERPLGKGAGASATPQTFSPSVQSATKACLPVPPRRPRPACGRQEGGGGAGAGGRRRPPQAPATHASAARRQGPSAAGAARGGRSRARHCPPPPPPVPAEGDVRRDQVRGPRPGGWAGPGRRAPALRIRRPMAKTARLPRTAGARCSPPTSPAAGAPAAPGPPAAPPAQPAPGARRPRRRAQRYRRAHPGREASGRPGGGREGHQAQARARERARQGGRGGGGQLLDHTASRGGRLRHGTRVWRVSKQGSGNHQSLMAAEPLTPPPRPPAHPDRPLTSCPRRGRKPWPPSRRGTPTGAALAGRRGSAPGGDRPGADQSPTGAGPVTRCAGLHPQDPKPPPHAARGDLPYRPPAHRHAHQPKASCRTPPRRTERGGGTRAT